MQLIDIIDYIITEIINIYIKLICIYIYIYIYINKYSYLIE